MHRKQCEIMPSAKNTVIPQVHYPILYLLTNVRLKTLREISKQSNTALKWIAQRKTAAIHFYFVHNKTKKDIMSFNDAFSD